MTGDDEMGATFGVEEWVELFREIGLDEATMHRWHARFESRAPEAHQGFLEWLGLGRDAVDRIRDRSRGAWAVKKEGVADG